jgi:hypothetical protein
MISSTKLEEFIVNWKDYNPLSAFATATVNDDGTTTIAAGVLMFGVAIDFDQVARLLAELPRAVEVAGALASRLSLDARKRERDRDVLKSVPAYDSMTVTSAGSGPVVQGGAARPESLQLVTPLQDDVATKPNASLPKVVVVPTNCSACAYSGIEPDDMNLHCGHPDAGTFGVSLRREPAEHCPDRVKFEQHPGRNPDGSLKSDANP